MNREEFLEIKEKFAKETRRRKISKWLNYISILFASIGIIISTNYFINNYKKLPIENQQNHEVENLKLEIFSLKEIIKQDKIKIDSLNHLILNSGNEIKIEKIEIVNKEILELRKELDNLNQIIIESPEKAISIPLLKSELSNLKSQNENKITSIQNDITRVYDMNKWIIGLIFSMLVSIIILNISNLFSKKNKE